MFENKLPEWLRISLWLYTIFIVVWVPVITLLFVPTALFWQYETTLQDAVLAYLFWTFAFPHLVIALFSGMLSGVFALVFLGDRLATRLFGEVPRY